MKTWYQNYKERRKETRRKAAEGIREDLRLASNNIKRYKAESSSEIRGLREEMRQSFVDTKVRLRTNGKTVRSPFLRAMLWCSVILYTVLAVAFALSIVGIPVSLLLAFMAIYTYQKHLKAGA